MQDMLSGSLKSLERSVSGRKVRIVRQIDPTTPPITARKGVMKKIIETILHEAAAGTEDGGRIRVCLKHNRAAVMISIKDDGPGMDPEDWIGRLGDASRPAAPGAPMSLAKCGAAVAGVGGNLFANARPGKGITYYLTFPPPAE
jgi:signal transduction histidine kinase